MAKAPFIGGFAAESADQNAQERSINWFPEKIEGKSDFRLRPTPGLRLFMTLPEHPIRGIFEASNNRVFVAAGASIYEIFENATYHVIGTIAAGTSAVSMDDNGFELVIVDNNSGYVFNFETSAYVTIVSDGFFPSPSVVVFDGYALMFRADTGVYFFSDQYNALSYDATDEGSAESNPDNIQNIIWDGGGPVILGTKSLEFYWNSGNANLVFERRPGAQLRYGCIAPFTALNVDDGVMWLGRDPNGQGNTYRVSGAQPTKFSSIFVDEAIQDVIGLENATAMAYEQSGHAFYCLNIPGTNTTLVCDLATSFWHERRSFDSNGHWGRWRVEKHALGFGLHLGTDYENGNLYVIDTNHYTDNGAIIRRERVLTPIYDPEKYDSVYFDSFMLDINVGDAPQGANPLIVLQASNDGGKTFGEGREKPLGAVGEYNTRVKWRKCGKARNRVFKVVTAAQTNVTIYNAFVEVSR